MTLQHALTLWGVEHQGAIGHLSDSEAGDLACWFVLMVRLFRDECDVEDRAALAGLLDGLEV